MYKLVYLVVFLVVQSASCSLVIDGLSANFERYKQTPHSAKAISTSPQDLLIQMITAISSDDLTELEKIAQLTDVNQKDKTGLTPAHHAAKSLNISALKILAEKGARMDATTPLNKNVQDLANESFNRRKLWASFTDKDGSPMFKTKEETEQQLSDFFDSVAK